MAMKALQTTLSDEEADAAFVRATERGDIYEAVLILARNLQHQIDELPE